MTATKSRTELGIDSDGFVSPEAFASALTRAAAHDVLQLITAPALVLAFADDGPGGDSGATERIRAEKRTAVFEVADVARVRRRRIAFLMKRAGNPFPTMVSVGRAMSNDIVLPIETVSKFQGYFIAKDGAWSFTDQRSANGTRLNGRLLDKGSRNAVKDGDKLTFGISVEAVFLMPGTLIERFRAATPP